jgi:hypothetical protein
VGRPDLAYFFGVLYPFQDRVLACVSAADTDFYLSRGTAASRGFLHHRVSDDLDLFVNDAPEFGLWSDRVISGLRRSAAWTCRVDLRDARFVRLTVDEGGVTLKVELVNDVPSRIGVPSLDPVLGRLDTAENILANKITALLGRSEAKDLADVWAFCTRLGLSLSAAISGAQGKAAGVFPADLARALYSATEDDWSAVRWIDPPPAATFIAELRSLAEELILPDGP